MELNFLVVWRKIKSRNVEILLLTSLLMLLVNSILFFLNKSDLSENNERITHTRDVLRQVDALSIELREAETAQRGYLLTGGEHYLQPYVAARTESNNVLDNLKKLLSDNVEQRKSLARLSAKVAEKFDEMENSIVLRRNKGYEAAIEAVKTDKGRIIMDNIRFAMSDMEQLETDFLMEREEILTTAVSSRSFWFVFNNISIIVILLLTFLNIYTEKKRKSDFLKVIEKNNSNLLLNTGEVIDSDNDSIIVETLSSNLNDAIQFITNVGEGKFDKELHGLTEANLHLNENTLAGALLNMRDKLSQISAEDAKRQWATEGIAHLGEILRKESGDVETLAHSVIINLVKYVNAIQGGLFVLNDNNPSDVYIEMVACYAYNRTKFLQKRIELGEGLIGEAVAEADTLYLTDIPQSYLRIASGLGDENPSYLLVVPLKINEQVLGAIELASFRPFDAHQIAFVEKTGESIAGTLSSIRINTQTKRLLADAQMQAEQMRAQEEEMRQNTEELQATQEESERRVRELLEVIAEKEAEIEVLASGRKK